MLFIFYFEFGFQKVYLFLYFFGFFFITSIHIISLVEFADFCLLVILILCYGFLFELSCKKPHMSTNKFHC